MDPAYFILLQNGICQPRSRCEDTGQDSLELARNPEATPRYNAKWKYVIAVVLVLGAGLFASAVFLGHPASTGAVAAQEKKSPAAACRYMTASLLAGGKLSAKSASEGKASVRCTESMRGRSSLCQEACTFQAP
jgi:hypothetical protein